MTTTFANADAVLEHFGVKGMKWGVRKDPGHEGEQVKTKQLKKLDKKWDKENTGIRGMIKINNMAAEKLNNGGFDAINNKPEYAEAASKGTLLDFDHPTTKKYHAEVETAMNKAFAEAGASIGMNPSGTKKYEAVIDASDGQPALRMVDTTKVKHADDGDLPTYAIDMTEQGLFTKLTELVVKHFQTADDVLAHFGVRGMKWGVRKPRGDRDEVFRKRAKEAQEVKVKTKPGQKVKTEGGKYAMPSDDAIRTATSKQIARKSSTDALTNKELQDVVTRLNLEKQYASLTAPQQSVGKRMVDALLGNAGDTEVGAIADFAVDKSGREGAGTAVKGAVNVAKAFNASSPKPGGGKKKDKS